MMPVCKCGCGEPTAQYRKTYGKRGIAKGQSADYLPGHQNRKAFFRCQHPRTTANTGKGNRRIDGAFRTFCLICRNAQQKAWREKNRETPTRESNRGAPGEARHHTPQCAVERTPVAPSPSAMTAIECYRAEKAAHAEKHRNARDEVFEAAKRLWDAQQADAEKAGRGGRPRKVANG